MGVIGIELMAIGSNELHNFVFSLSGHIGASENYGQTLPIVVFLNFLFDEEVEIFVELLHEPSSRRNRVVFKVLL